MNNEHRGDVGFPAPSTATPDKPLWWCGEVQCVFVAMKVMAVKGRRWWLSRWVVDQCRRGLHALKVSYYVCVADPILYTHCFSLAYLCKLTRAMGQV